MKDLKSSEGRDLLAFNEALNHPCGTIDICVLLKEGRKKMTLKVCFLIMSFSTALHIMASTVHFKMKYHNSSEDPSLL